MPPRKKSAEPQKASKPARRSTQKFVRNLHGSPVALRLADDTRIELRPRGQRGDLAAITKPQEKDAKLMLNVGLTVEVISEAEAKKVVEGQSTNQQAFHPALRALRNQLGEEYDQTDVPLTEDPQDKGETVAYLDDSGNVATERVPGKGEQMVRNPAKRSVGPRVATGLPGGDDEYADLLSADEAAKSGESLEDVLGGYEVDR